MTETPRARTRTRVTRQIAADPTSTALLLAGPTAMDLWPGVRRVGDAGGRTLVEAHLGGCDSVSTAAAVRALPPRRTPTSYVTRFGWSGPGLPSTEAELVLAYLPGRDGPTTHAALVLHSEEVAASRINEADLQAMAEGFLANLAAAAEQRRDAA